MNNLTWSQTQIRRFKDLCIDWKNIPADFSTPAQRNKLFQQIEKNQVKNKKSKLKKLFINPGKTKLDNLIDNLTDTLNQQGFTHVSTPIIINKSALAKMTINEDHPLFKQIYWINKKQCLRPMLAPNLYSLMIDFSRLKYLPIRFFEIGSCFRKESDGALHNSEFTMLNLVEMGLEKKDRDARLKELSDIVLEAAEISDYRFESEDSTVYGTTLDVVAGPKDIEVASGAVGPHPLDIPWGIVGTWAGIGFGVERLLMISQEDTSIGRWSKNLSYLDGIRLNI